MIEAFEIGVSLALRDGVSEGIAAARRDMALIETAIRSNGVSLEALRRAGNRVLETTRTARAADRVGVSIPGTVAKQSAAGPQGGGAALPNPVEALPATRKAIVPHDPVNVGPNAGAAPPSPAVPAPPEPFGPRTSPQQPTSGLATPDRPNTRPVGPSPEKPAPAAPPNVTNAGLQAVKPRAQAASTAPGAPGAVPAGSNTRADGVAVPLRVQIGGSAPGRAAFGPAPGGAAEPAAPTAPVAREVASAAGPGVDTAAPTGWAGVPPGVAPPPVTVGHTPAGAAGTGGGDARPGDTIPVHGDVFLDGVLVGRWMCRFLARQAGRDPAGPTGFDPRRNPVLPGATIGLS